ncbi:hypothetical protein LINPERHAP2_LOCUS32695 [Linum perenne]
MTTHRRHLSTTSPCRLEVAWLKSFMSCSLCEWICSKYLQCVS